MIITITNIGDATHQSKGKSVWSEMKVTYSSDKGEREKVFRSFDSAIWEKAKSLVVGKSYDVSVKKNDKGFWEWTSINETTAAAAPRSGGASSGAKSEYWDEKAKLDIERFDFEKEKQNLIIRQSCISSAVASLPPGVSVEQILERAERFERFVNGIADLTQMDVD